MLQSQQQTQLIDVVEEELRMSINLPQVEYTSEELGRILRSHKMSSNFYNESTLCNLLCKLKDRVATEDKKQDRV